MTVNYTTNLALGQPVTGTESGTWGDDVNNAVTSYLDIAIAGGLAITITTTDVTLSITQGTSVATNIGSTTAQYAILNVSGAMTAARNLIVPSSSRIYLINNNTTGGFALTVKGSATSGVTLVNGEKAHVFWNGTDYAKMSNASGGAGVFSSITNSGLTSGRVVYSTTGGLETDSANLTFNGTTLTANTIGAFTLSGTIAGGGNQINNVIIGTTTPLAGAFTTLSATGNTTLGDATTDTVTVSGYMGLGGSAANSTIGLNAGPTALTGTNQIGAQFFPTGTSAATASVRGVYARGDTAAASFTCGFSSAFYAADPTKGAGSTITNLYGLYIADQTVGTNNYGITSLVSSGTDKWNIYASGTAVNYMAGQLQLGDGSAAAPALSNFGDTNTGIFFPAADTIAFTEGGAESMRLDSSGNLGIGVTPSAWNTYKTISVGDTGSSIAGTANQILLTTNAYYSTGFIYSTTNVAAYYQQTTGEHRWLNAPSGTAGTAITFTQAMTLTQAGNLGLGITSADARLRVVGAGTNPGAIRIGYNGTSVNYIDADTNIFRTGAAAETMRLDSSGNLGIGTSSPAVRLDVVATATGTNVVAARFANDGLTSGSTVRINFITGEDGTAGRTRAIIEALAPAANDGALGFQTRLAGTVAEKMRLDSSGNLGLGVTPSAWGGTTALQLAGSGFIASNNQYLEISTNTYYNSGYKYIGTGLATEYSQQAGVHAWKTAASGTAGNAITFTQAMTLDASGNLLVGTTSAIGRVGSAFPNTQYGFTASCTSASGTAVFNRFLYNTSTEVGTISSTGTVTLYNTSSDQRLKENIQDAAPASVLIDAIQVRQFDWKSDGSHTRYGFVAQELVTVAPEAVHQPADPEEMMAVDYSKLVPMLVKEIQSLRKRLTALEST